MKKKMTEKAELVTVRMRPSLRDALEKAAKTWGISKTKIVEEALTTRLEMGLQDGIEARLSKRQRELLEDLKAVLALGEPRTIRLLEAVVQMSQPEKQEDAKTQEP